jgi:hypothetical protein
MFGDVMFIVAQEDLIDDDGRIEGTRSNIIVGAKSDLVELEPNLGPLDQNPKPKPDQRQSSKRARM